MTTPIRLLLIDDHTLFRESLVRLLEAEPEFQIIAHHATLAKGLEVLAHCAIDVVLLDYDLGQEFGTDLLSDCRICKSGTKILIVTAGMRDSVMIAALGNGVAGIVFKHSGPRQLIEAIYEVQRGQVWLDRGVMRSLIAEPGTNATALQNARSLSERQHDVLRCILEGLTNKEIAAKMRVSETSIKAVIQILFSKAGVRTRSQLVKIAIEKYASDWLTTL